MQVKDKVCVITGAAGGIGEAVARAYAAAGARGVVVADLKSSRDRLASVAGDIDGLARSRNHRHRYIRQPQGDLRPQTLALGGHPQSNAHT